MENCNSLTVSDMIEEIYLFVREIPVDGATCPMQKEHRRIRIIHFVVNVTHKVIEFEYIFR